jgi:hypothetical protein
VTRVMRAERERVIAARDARTRKVPAEADR